MIGFWPQNTPQFPISLRHWSQIFFPGASFEVCKQPVVAGGQIRRIGWVQKRCEVCRILVNSVKFLQKETPLSNSAEDKIHEWTPLMQMSWIGPFS